MARPRLQCCHVQTSAYAMLFKIMPARNPADDEAPAHTATVNCYTQVVLLLTHNKAPVQQALPEQVPQQAARQVPQQITLRAAAPPPPERPAPVHEPPPPPRSRKVADLLPDLPMPSRVSLVCCHSLTGEPAFSGRQKHDAPGVNQTWVHGCCSTPAAAQAPIRWCIFETQHLVALCMMQPQIPHICDIWQLTEGATALLPMSSRRERATMLRLHRRVDTARTRIRMTTAARPAAILAPVPAAPPQLCRRPHRRSPASPPLSGMSQSTLSQSTPA
jgi:hypothetical protein